MKEGLRDAVMLASLTLAGACESGPTSVDQQMAVCRVYFDAALSGVPGSDICMQPTPEETRDERMGRLWEMGCYNSGGISGC